MMLLAVLACVVFVSLGLWISYYSDLRKMRAHYPTWDITQSLEETIRQIVESWRTRQKN